MTCPEKLQAIIQDELDQQKKEYLYPSLLYRRDTLHKKTEAEGSCPEAEEQMRSKTEERADPMERLIYANMPTPDAVTVAQVLQDMGDF